MIRVTSFTVTLTLTLTLTLVNGKMLVPGLEPSRYVVPGDISIGVLVDVLDEGGSSSDSEKCSSMESTDIATTSIQLCEAAVYAARQINALDDLLPNITLGLVCMDTCNSPLSALARAVYLVEDQPPDDSTASPHDSSHLTHMELEHHRVYGVVGPIQSDQAVLVSSYLSVFQIPVLGTYTTSDELSDKSRFPYFFRLAPPDRFQAQAIIDLIRYFQWEYIGLIYSEGSYGEYGAKQILSLVEQHDLCLAYSYRISLKYVPREEQEVLQLFADNPRLKVVIWFAEVDALKRIFGAVTKKYPVPNTVYLFSYLSGYMPVLYPKASTGSFTVTTTIAPVPGFLDYFTGLVPGNNTKNTWLHLAWQKTFDCEWSESGNNSCSSYRADRRWYGYLPIITPYYDGTYVYAHALHEVISVHCPQAFTNKSLLKDCIKGPDLLKAMHNLTITAAAGDIAFNEDGDILGKYAISHTKTSPEGKPVRVRIGSWDKLRGTLEIQNEEVDLTIFRSSDNSSRLGQTQLLDGGEELFIPYSVCSWPCGLHEYLIQKKTPCCWECQGCRENEVVINSTTCESCPQFRWPDSDTFHFCVNIPPTFLRWQDSIGIALTFFSVTGMAVVLAFARILWKKRSVRLVKASNKELSFVMLLGAFLACACVLIFVAKPTRSICLLRNIGFNFAVNLLYSPMLVKTCRVYRIFRSGRKGLKRPRFISSMAQAVMATISILGQVILLLFVELLFPSSARLLMPVATERYVELTCAKSLTPFLLPLTYNVIFILICAVLGFVARRLPQNFNESGFIFISVATTLFAWMVFLPSYFTAAKAHHQSAILGLCLLLNAYITVGCLFAPKVYALYYVDEDLMGVNSVTKPGATNQVSATVTVTHLRSSRQANPSCSTVAL